MMSHIARKHLHSIVAGGSREGGEGEGIIASHVEQGVWFLSHFCMKLPLDFDIFV